jgi:5-methyltetrahydropteroyltriglutamate--homocysteine methyltransferase
MITRRYLGEHVDELALEGMIEEGVRAVVARQLDLGLDVVSDGEFSKVGFSQYIRDRVSGFTEAGSARVHMRDVDDFPSLRERVLGQQDASRQHATAVFRCSGPVEVSDATAVHRDIERLRDALGARSPAGGFMGAPTPGHIAFNFPNEHYPDEETYLHAVADAMRVEYRAITDAGFALQLDSPDLAMAAHVRTSGWESLDFRVHSEQALEALRYAIEGIDPSLLRLHVCWGNYPGPHHRDVALKDIVGPILKVNVGTLSFEAANPRHAHEWEVFQDCAIPDHLILLPGVIDVTTNRIEHPRLIAQRLERFASIVGRDRVMAGTDCGFSTVAGWELIDPAICWAKLGSLVEGARIASEGLWSSSARHRALS